MKITTNFIKMGIIGNYRVIRPANHEEWLEERKKGLGSSEVGTIMGVNAFDTPLKLWRRKCGLDAPIEETDVMALGHAVEAGVAYMFARATGAIIDDSSAIDWIAVSKEMDFLRVSPDRLFWPAGTPESERTMANAYMLECKTTSKCIDKDSLPQYWFCQIQYQMGVLGLKKCAIGWISAAGGRWSFDYTWVDFNEAFFNNMLRHLVKFWGLVQSHTMPRYAISADDLRILYPIANKDSVLTLSSDCEEDRKFVKLAKEYQLLCDKSKELDARKDEIKTELGNRIQDKERVIFDDTKIISFSSQKGKSSLDGKRLKAERPEVYDEYLTEGNPFRVFKVLSGLNSVEIDA